MRTLPLPQIRIFLGKLLLTAGVWLSALAIEALCYGFCCPHWFPGEEFLPELLQNFSFFFLAGLPTCCLMLLVASLCQNMWVSLGTGVVLAFAATLVPSDSLLSLLPFVLPYRIAGHGGTPETALCLGAVFAELVFGILLQHLITLFRRSA